MVAGMQRIIRETGAEYTNCYLHMGKVKSKCEKN